MTSKIAMQNYYKRKMCEPECEQMKVDRIDYLALDKDVVKNAHCLGPRVNFALSKNGAWEIMPLDQKFPFAFAAAKQVLYSCSKIGTNLFLRDNTAFNLSDPSLYQSRFTIEYNSLYDPALQLYYQRPGVYKLLRQANVINDRDDAICSKRYFFEYVKYLERRRAAKMAEYSMQRV